MILDKTMIDEYVAFAFRTFKERPLRTTLTMIGIFIGIAAVVALLSIGRGFQSYIDESFQEIGADKIYIVPGPSFFEPGQADSKLTAADLTEIKKVRGVEDAGGMIFSLARVKIGDETFYLFVWGAPTDDSFKIVVQGQSVGIEEGRFIKEEDSRTANIGWLLANDNPLGKNIQIRQKIEIEGEEYRVVGSMERIGNQNDDSSIMIKLDEAEELFEKEDEFDFIIVQAAQGEDLEVVRDRIERKLRSFRDLDKGEEDFSVQTAQELMETFQAVFGMVQVIIVGLAAVSLIVGGIGIMNTMYTAVLDRTNEIGVMKAIGAKNSDVLGIFLVESGLLGLIGGAVGALIGMLIAMIVGNIANSAGYVLLITFPPPLILGVLAFSFVVGAVSGFVPALQASKLQPVESLRYE